LYVGILTKFTTFLENLAKFLYNKIKEKTLVHNFKIVLKKEKLYQTMGWKGLPWVGILKQPCDKTTIGARIP
jgi:hypothetical protein